MSSVRLMVLGVIATSDQVHGYKIYRQINDWRSETWTSIKPGSIYHALTYLLNKSYIDDVGLNAETRGPAATSYRINSQGQKELQRLIKNALVSYNQEEFTAGLAWMQLLNRQEVLSLAKQRLEQYKQTCKFMRTLPRDAQPTTPDKHPEIIGSWTALFDATTAWMEGYVSHIEAGQYRFLGEK